MPTIGNWSLNSMQRGRHKSVPENTILISIRDPYYYLPNSHEKREIESSLFAFKSKSKFKEIYTFYFHDIEKYEEKYELVSSEQIVEISNILKNAFESNTNIYVHCHAGVCRSGAVVEAGLLLGFELSSCKYMKKRIPNSYLFNELRKQLGFTYSFEEE